jgi:hypothetical protein
MTVLRRSRAAGVVSKMRSLEDGVGDVAGGTKGRCANCHALSSDEYCGNCGSKMDESSNPYILAAESIFKVSAIKNSLEFYWRILKSPTKNTIHSFEVGRLSDGIRFLEYSASAYLLAIATAGYVLFSEKELVQTVIQPVFLFVTWTVSYTFYYLAMRNKGSKRRTPLEFLFLLMSNPRFYFADGNSSICRHNWMSYFLNPRRSDVYLSYTGLEVLLGSVRASRVLVTPLVHHPGWHRWYIDLGTCLALFRIIDAAINIDSGISTSRSETSLTQEPATRLLPHRGALAHHRIRVTVTATDCNHRSLGRFRRAPSGDTSA